MICIVLRISTVVMIVHCYKTNTKHREYFFQISPCFNVVSSQSGKVFYDDTVNLMFFCIFKHLLKTRTLKS